MTWVKENQLIVALVILSVTVLLLAAMWFGLDLSWIPGLLLRFAPKG